MANFKDLTGRQWGKLTVVKLSEEQNHPHKYWDCLCACGAIASIASNDIQKGNIVSCGCYRREAKVTHGMRRHPLYDSFRGMKERCASPTHKGYKYYGGRGIQVCVEWLDDPCKFFYWALANGWAKGLSIDRIDVDGGYSPKNCKWSTRTEQAQNKTDTVWVEYAGDRMCKGDFIRRHAVVHRDTIRHREKNLGMDFLDAALTTPQDLKRRRHLNEITQP